MYLSTYPGDPTTPGYPAYENATRIEPTNVPHTPSLPLSWANAQRLLAELGGVDEGRVLNGKISEKKVKLVNNVDTKITPIWNTMAAIPGHIKDEVVILGCHRDAWVMGAVDPISGTVSMYEVIRGLGSLLRRGWKPLRTIVIASWDAEEYGLVGSTEWAEDFADWIQQHAVSYVNVDVSVAGSRLAFSASPSLAHLMKRTAQDVPHPTDPERTLWDAQFDVGPFPGELDADFAEQHAKHESKRAALTTGIDALGSGSDYTVFLQRLGVASSDQGFGSTPMDAVYHYHSIYDSEQWSELYGDPGFLRRVAVAKSLGLLTLRLADSIVLPLNTTQYAYELDLYLDRVEDAALSQDALPKLKDLRKAITKLQSASLKLDKEKAAAEKNFRKILKRFARGRRFHAAVKRAIKWLKKHLGLGKDDANHEHGCKGDGIMGGLSDPWSYLSLDEGDLERLTLGEKVKHGKFPIHKLPLRKFIKAAQRVRRVNKKLSAFEQGFISEGGIKDREWYKHLGVAPGKYLGYGATTLPALTEAVLYEQNATLAEYEAHRLTKLIENLAHNLKV
ncbi:hypothetical protein SERLA73DRAFT_177776 [Serpula lacrymans var. lacrymans S7.3]|uniref:Zn-dependent exopeptidase n=2 Tax=Serpula lacrymans var. lacrymans TaxID=341189 RepID=F8PPI1_SERL3|nr:uncharacterized protein SERLADRAFT_461557 [Serpula lacrymans var. lacrymans S7.9]EGO02058.1 hypothetical protein SERLA73DRAFT_177776 [Serpula lacrymans var. lacrymans S7.3]EGO27680.1 hypothetical protein SERLADRAFT_461557 [Serpula lacrymans var. lacrymans S7.9]